MFCINCGKQLEDGSRFCPYCGAKVPDPASYKLSDLPNPTGAPENGPAGNPDTATPFQPQNPEGADQGQTGAGYWSQPDNSDSGQSGSGFQSQTDAGYWSQPGSADSGQSGSGFQSQTDAGYWSQPGSADSGQSGSGFQSQPGAGYWGQSGSGDPSQSGSGFQGQQGGGYQNQNKGGFDPWAMKGGPAQTGAGVQDDPWGGPGGANGTTMVKPKKKKHTVRNVILIVLGVVVLALVGLYILGSTVTGKYKPMIDSYLSYAEDGDTQRVESLFYPTVVEDYKNWYSSTDAIYYLDSWTDNYGMSVDRYEIAEVDQEEDELEYFNDLYGLQATSYVDVTADVYYDNGRYACMDFDMVEIDGSWYLVDIW